MLWADGSGFTLPRHQDFAEASRKDHLNEIDRTVRENVAAAIPILITRANSIEEARARHPGIFRLDPSVRLTGKVRVVVIQNTDANPCNALHWHNSAIGSYGFDVVPVERDELGEFLELRFELT
jgi:Ser-tRNA(Ala) deacylase AlaX